MNTARHIFAFDDPIEFLNFELHQRQKKDSRFSLRAWSRQVGYKNPSYLSHVLNRKRRLKPKFAQKLASDLSLSGPSLRYFELLVLKQNTDSAEETQTLQHLIKAARPKKFKSVNKISLETFSLVSDWYHWAILEMTELADFNMTPQQIQLRLGGKVNITTIRAAIDRLLRAGLLKKSEKGNLVRGQKGANETESTAPREAVISYFRQMGTLALEALTKQPQNEREFYSTTLAFRRENYPRALKVIEEAHKQLLQLAAQGTGEDIYQFNTQFFKLTEPPKKSRSTSLH